MAVAATSADLLVRRQRVGDPDVGLAEGEEGMALDVASFQGGDFDVDERDEAEVSAIEEIGETALVALGRQRHVTDDAVLVGLEDRPFDPVRASCGPLHRQQLYGGRLGAHATRHAASYINKRVT